MYNWVGRFKFFLAILVISTPSVLLAAKDPVLFLSNDISTWESYAASMEAQSHKDYEAGLSYVISGSLALAGGLIGESVTSDNLEKATYTIFQTIGIASIGYGAYTWKVGNADRDIYLALSRSKLTFEQRAHFLKVYKLQKLQTERKEKNIKAITHALIGFFSVDGGMQSVMNG